MTPAFGFSVGDFISAINLIRKISKALKETGGASSEYQDAVIELKGLKHALQHLEALEPTEDNVSHVNAIRGMALACKLPLQDFMTKLEKYESSLGPWVNRKSFQTAGRKARWALSFGQEVEKLRALVAAKQISINLLLAMHSSQTLASITSQAKRGHRDLMTKVVDTRAALHQVTGIVENIEARIEGIETTSRTRMDTMASNIEATAVSVMGLRALGGQIMGFVRTFPQEIRDLLQTIIQADWRTYQAVLQIQERLSRTPTSWHESNIQFTNALGEYRELPYEYFCQWEPFEGFLRAQFKNKPGESKIIDGKFHIIDLQHRRSIVKKEDWNRFISRGAVLTMSMVMSHLRRKPGQCPRPDCTGVGIVKCCDSDQLTCGTCHLKFFPDSNDLAHSLSRVAVSEDDVACQQAEEDLQLYGSRPEPPDAVEVDEAIQLTGLLSKQSASTFKAAVDRPARIRTGSESQAYIFHAVTAIDWNSGASPLDSWLNQSAVPSSGVPTTQHIPEHLAKDPIAEEVEEIKVFRNVHVSIEPNLARPKADLTEDFVASMELGAQIYYRNIMDRYPSLPLYLAYRLAQANHKRAERLRVRRQGSWVPSIDRDSDRVIKPIPKFQSPWKSVATSSAETGLSPATQSDQLPRRFGLANTQRLPRLQSMMGDVSLKRKPSSTQKKHKCKIYDKKFTRPSTLQTHMYNHTEDKPYACEAEGCGRHFSVVSNLRRHRKVHESNRRSEHDASGTPNDSLVDSKAHLNGSASECHSNPFPKRLPMVENCLSQRTQENCVDEGSLVADGVTCQAEDEELPNALIRPQYISHDLAIGMSDLDTALNWLDHEKKSDKHIEAAWRDLSPRNNDFTTLRNIYQAEDTSHIPENYSSSEFWTGESRGRRPSSIRSYSSSRNSSLRGDSAFDPQEQGPTFHPTSSRSSSFDFDGVSPGLPPPPAEIGKKLSFMCDVCGDTIRVDKRRQWQ